MFVFRSSTAQMLNTTFCRSSSENILDESEIYSLVTPSRCEMRYHWETVLQLCQPPLRLVKQQLWGCQRSSWDRIWRANHPDAEVNVQTSVVDQSVVRTTHQQAMKWTNNQQFHTAVAAAITTITTYLGLEWCQTSHPISNNIGL